MTAADQDPHAGPDRGVDWSVPCRDAFGRRRSVGVMRKPAGVVLVAPPGESAMLDYGHLRELITGLAQEAGHLRPIAEA